MEVEPSKKFIAFSDETHHNVGRYRGIALLTMSDQHVLSLREEIRNKLIESQVDEFSWERLRTAKSRFAAIKMIESVISYSSTNKMRIDVVVWDVQDSRHSIPKRDDVANFCRMYFHLFKNVLKKRWPTKSEWYLYPDQNEAMDWDNLQTFLDMNSIDFDLERNIFDQERLSFVLKHEFNISKIKPVSSINEPLIQVADLFAGLAVYSRTCYERFETWLTIEDNKKSLFRIEGATNISLSSSDRDRCFVLNEFNQKCKAAKLGVSLKTNKGLRTPRPERPINFWWYQPQHLSDKAPIKNI